MENNQNQNNVLDLITKPENVQRAFNDPANFGKEVFENMTNKQKQYLAFAAGAGLIGYGFFIGKKQ